MAGLRGGRPALDPSNLTRVIPAEGRQTRALRSFLPSRGKEHFMRAVIFAAGGLPDLEAVRRELRPDDWILAADGGARHCRDLGLTPAILIGDMDSLDAEGTDLWARAGVKVIPHPAHKDETDLELALLHAVRQGAEEILVMGAMGTRWDHSLANFLISAHPELRGIRLRLGDGRQQAWLIEGETLVEGEVGDFVSLLPVGGDAVGITTSGLEYPLLDETIRLGSPRGLSNVLTQPRARITIRQGRALVVVVPMEAKGGFG